MTGVTIWGGVLLLVAFLLLVTPTQHAFRQESKIQFDLQFLLYTKVFLTQDGPTVPGFPSSLLLQLQAKNGVVPNIVYSGNSVLARISVPFENRRFRDSTLSLWIVPFPSPVLKEVSRLLNCGYGFTESVIFFFILLKPDQILLQNSIKFSIYSAQIHFIFLPTHNQTPFPETYFVSTSRRGYTNAHPLKPSGIGIDENSISNLLKFGNTHSSSHLRKFPLVLAAFRGSPNSICDTLSPWCSPTHRFVHLAKQHFNFSLLLYTSDLVKDVSMTELSHPRHPHSLFLGGESYVKWYRSVGPDHAPYIRDSEGFYILYCENGWRTVEGSSYSQWTSPFPLVAWCAILISAIGVALVGAKFKAEELLPRILDTLAIILREPMGNPDKFQFLHVLLALSFLILSLKYESVLTSEMTVPAPPLIVRNLHELILSRGFKLFFPVYNRTWFTYYDMTEFQAGFAQYGVQEFYPNIQGKDFPNSTKLDCLSNRSNKLGTDVPGSERSMALLEFGGVAIRNGRYCHIVPAPFFKRHYSLYVKGHGFGRIIQFLHQLRQVGLEVMWNRNSAWLLKLRKMREFMRTPNAGEVFGKYSPTSTAPHEAMAASDKFTQIFIITGVLASFALFCWLAELILGFLSNAGNRIIILS